MTRWEILEIKIKIYVVGHSRKVSFFPSHPAKKEIGEKIASNNQAS